MNLFLDTNVLLDFFVEDRPNSTASLKIFTSVKNQEHRAYCTAISISDCLYVLEVSYKVKDASVLLQGIISYVEILPTLKPSVELALSSNFKDKEDALQYHTAKAFGEIGLIITSDKKGFAQSKIPVLTPAQFVAKHLSAK